MKESMSNGFLQTIALADDAVVILDQNRLPLYEEYVSLRSIEEVYDAIKQLRVRGAPAIGIAAAMGVYIHMRNKAKENPDIRYLTSVMENACKYLSSSRPTAVNLNWALERMKRVFGGTFCDKRDPIQENVANCTAGMDGSRQLCTDSEYVSAHECSDLANRLLKYLKNEALLILQEDMEACKKIGEYGADLIKQGMGVLTHCNAGSLATAKYGTALAPIYLAHERGVKLRVYADETRPFLQGARLTAYELHKAGVDVTLICDNMAAAVMSKKLVELIFVGCDRVAANGDVANKIGTLNVAVLAEKFGIPFYVCAPFSTIDPKTASGEDILIEERDGAEITELWYRERMAPVGVKTFNPAFDVTPAELITGFITEKGIMDIHEVQKWNAL